MFYEKTCIRVVFFLLSLVIVSLFYFFIIYRYHFQEPQETNQTYEALQDGSRSPFEPFNKHQYVSIPTWITNVVYVLSFVSSVVLLAFVTVYLRINCASATFQQYRFGYRHVFTIFCLCVILGLLLFVFLVFRYRSPSSFLPNAFFQNLFLALMLWYHLSLVRKERSQTVLETLEVK